VKRDLLIDLDGVLYQGNNVIPGAVEALGWIHQENIPHVFITNTTSRPRIKIVKKLASFGINVMEDSILTPPVAACSWLSKYASGYIVSECANLTPITGYINNKGHVEAID